MKTSQTATERLRSPGQAPEDEEQDVLRKRWHVAGRDSLVLHPEAVGSRGVPKWLGSPIGPLTVPWASASQENQLDHQLPRRLNPSRRGSRPRRRVRRAKSQEEEKRRSWIRPTHPSKKKPLALEKRLKRHLYPQEV